ncbi:hypothetical protein M011DRAFT_349878 [Sporormia fimetaria CBS 119925]|uniref:Uncharacterized protein n=1 Tax=Sporormia fimetaria CBS 119925 TaxID=1340428 RepID=A0A6A6VGZ2_9PLEO|nr:hypothetical protein M011DRAFT_349878 [Sporormia fimetaria CBS 119925]
MAWIRVHVCAAARYTPRDFADMHRLGLFMIRPTVEQFEPTQTLSSLFRCKCKCTLHRQVPTIRTVLVSSQVRPGFVLGLILSLILGIVLAVVRVILLGIVRRPRLLHHSPVNHSYLFSQDLHLVPLFFFLVRLPWYWSVLKIVGCHFALHPLLSSPIHNPLHLSISGATTHS